MVPPMHPHHLAQLTRLCDDHPIQRKVVFAPSPQVGYNLTTALAAAGKGWVNLCVTTPAGWAEAQVGPQLQAEGWKRLEWDADLFYLSDLVARTLEDDPSNYFARLATSPGLVRSFHRTLRAMGLAGVDPEALGRIEDGTGKTSTVAGLYRAYRAWLVQERYYDDAIVFERALARTVPPASPVVFAILDETPLPGLVFDYVRTVAHGTLSRIGLPDYTTPPPAHTAATRFAHAPFPEVETGGERVAAGNRVATLGRADGSPVRLWEALGAENEVRGVLRDIVRNRTPADTVEIAYTTESPYLHLIHDAAERHSLPARFSRGVPVTVTRPGQCLLGFYRWVESGLLSSELIGMCRAGLLSFAEVLGDANAPEPDRVASILQKARIGRGRDRYALALDRLCDTLARDLSQLPEGAERAGAVEADLADLPSVKQIVDALLQFVPPHRTSAGDITRRSVEFLSAFAPVRTDRDRAACDSLEERLQEMGRFAASEAETPHLAARLGELMSEHKVDASVAVPGHLYVVPVDRAGYTGRQHLYVLGLDEASFPGGAPEDPILLDDEQMRVSDGLALHRSRPAEQVWQMGRLLSTAAGTVTLVSSRCSLSDGRETCPSALFQRLQDELGQDSIPRFGPLPPDSDHALDGTEAMLASHPAAGYGEAVGGAFPWLRDGQCAVESRLGHGLTRFDGWLGGHTPELDVARGTQVVSASRLESLARCPYRYFLRYVLRADPPEEVLEAPSRWLSPLEFGLFLHDVFREFMETAAARGERPDVTKHTPLLHELLDRRVDAQRDICPVENEAAFRADRAHLLRSADVFLASESKREAPVPAGFEVSFGLGKEGGLNRPGPVPLQLSERSHLLLRGQIDRIDRVEGGHEIWDYKTGSASTYDEQDLLRNGTHLQWALYACALEVLVAGKGLPPRVVSSGYFFASDREHGRRISNRPPSVRDLGHILEPILDLAAQGCFYHIQKENQCPFCDYRSLCESERLLPADVDASLGAVADCPDIVALLEHWLNV